MVHKGGKWHKRNEVELPEQSIPRNGRGDNGMKEELCQGDPCRKARNRRIEFRLRGNMTEAILLGNIAMRAGGKFKWDAKTMKTNRKDADKLVSKVYRGGWEVDPA